MTSDRPSGLRVSEKLLTEYRALQDRYAEPQLDAHHRDRAAERLEGRILKACDLFPWTPAEVFYWTFAWLHLLSYGREAESRQRHQRFYGPMRGERGLIPAWDGSRWVLAYPDLDRLVDTLDEADRRRHSPLH